jgi:hypothetical protein
LFSILHISANGIGLSKEFMWSQEQIEQHNQEREEGERRFRLWYRSMIKGIIAGKNIKTFVEPRTPTIVRDESGRRLVDDAIHHYYPR